MKNNFYLLKKGNYKKLLLNSLLMLFLLAGFSASAQLNGAYTLDPSSPASNSNYTNLTSFVNNLRGIARTDGGPYNGPGVSGPVTLNIAANITMTEQIQITAISGMNATNRVTINGNNALLQFNSTNTSAKHTLWLNGADFFTFNNLRVDGLNATNVITVRFSGQADYNIFDGCTLSASQANSNTQIMSSFTATFLNPASATAVVAFHASATSLDNRTTGVNGRGNVIQNSTITGPVDNSTLMGPAYGIFEQGSTGTTSGQNQFLNNTIKNFSGAGYYSWYASSCRIIGNTVTRKLNSRPTSITSNYMYAIYANYFWTSQHNQDFVIEGNTVTGLGDANGLTNAYYLYGIVAAYWNGTTTAQNIPTRLIINKNNISCNYAGNNLTTSAYFYGLDAYYAGRALITNNILANNLPLNVTGFRYNYFYTFYVYYSKGADVFHNTLYSDFTLATNTYFYHYSPYIYDCCNANTTSNSWERVRFNNNIIHDNIRTTNSGTYHYLYSYFYYITEIRNNTFFSAQNTNNTDIYYQCYIGNSTACVSSSQFFPALNNGTSIVNNTKANSNFVNGSCSNSDFAFTNPANNAAGMPLGVVQDFYGTPRNMSAPDRGAIEVPFDYSISGTFQGGSAVCGSYSENLKFRINNLMPFALPMGRLGFRLNNNPVQIQERGPVPANGSLEVTFDNPVNFFGQPANSVLKVFIAHADDNNVNDTLTFNITVTPSPSGSTLTAVPSQAQLSDFATINPDVTIPGEAVEFRVSPPTGFTNAGYGTTWTATANAFRVSDNAPVTGLTWTAPAGGNNGTWRYNPLLANTNDIVEIQLQIRNLGNGCDSTLRRRVFVAPTGSSQFKIPSQICVGEEIEFENESDVSSGFLLYSWDFGNGQTSDATNGRTTFNSSGTYNVKLYNITNPYGFVTSKTVPVTVTEAPAANFSFINKCFGTPVQFSNSSTVGSGSISSTSWEFGDGRTATGLTTNNSYANQGLYAVTMTTTANGCTKSITKNVVQFAQPTADFSLVNGTCQFTDFTFANNSTVESGSIGYMWKFDDNGALSTNATPTHKFQTFGSKNVRLIATTALGCVDSITKTIVVSEGPSAQFSTSPLCQFDAIELNSSDVVPSGVNATYTWTLPDGSSSSSVNEMFSASLPGTYPVSLAVSYDNGCQAMTSRNLSVLPKPVPAFEVANTCSGTEVGLENMTTNTNGSISYFWDLGDGNNSTARAPFHTYTANGQKETFTVKLTATIDGACSAEVEKEVEVFPAPSTCDFEIAMEGVNGWRNYKFTPSNGSTPGADANLSYSWFFGDGSSSTSPVSEYNYNRDGIFTVTMVAKSDDGCECRAIKTVSVDLVSVAGVEKESGFVVYPNPSTGLFYVELVKVSEPTATVQVMDAVGSVVLTTTVKDLQANGGKVNLSGMANGMYFVKLTSSNAVGVQKIQISK
jgi:PKD repeat protein